MYYESDVLISVKSSITEGKINNHLKDCIIFLSDALSLLEYDSEDIFIIDSIGFVCNLYCQAFITKFRSMVKNENKQGAVKKKIPSKYKNQKRNRVIFTQPNQMDLLQRISSPGVRLFYKRTLSYCICIGEKKIMQYLNNKFIIIWGTVWGLKDETNP